MTESELIQAAQGRLSDYTEITKDSITDAVSVAVAMLCSRHQWEFLTRYDELSAAVDSDTGKTYVDVPGDFFQPIFFWTGTRDLTYISLSDWGREQRISTASRTPEAFTIFNKRIWLSHASDGSEVYALYTADASQTSFGDVYGQYHYAILAAVVMWLTPRTLPSSGGQKIHNPDYDMAKADFDEAIERAIDLEESKAKIEHLKPPVIQRERSNWR